MTYEQWVARVDDMRMQLTEGAITHQEFFNAVIFYATDVAQEPEPTQEPTQGENTNG